MHNYSSTEYTGEVVSIGVKQDVSEKTTEVSGLKKLHDKKKQSVVKWCGGLLAVERAGQLVMSEDDTYSGLLWVLHPGVWVNFKILVPGCRVKICEQKWTQFSPTVVAFPCGHDFLQNWGEKNKKNSNIPIALQCEWGLTLATHHFLLLTLHSLMVIMVLVVSLHLPKNIQTNKMYVKWKITSPKTICSQHKGKIVLLLKEVTRICLCLGFFLFLFFKTAITYLVATGRTVNTKTHISAKLPPHIEHRVIRENIFLLYFFL